MKPTGTGWLAGLLWGAAALAAAPPVRAADVDEFKVKREAVFEFTEKPALERASDKVTITFASKACCDATVAVEDANGKIVRHLASGVLGKKAPEPFQKDSLKQRLVWDGKDDQGRYLDDKDGLTVRVSLGLRPRFERNLFWSPKKKVGALCPRIGAAQDGVYVYDGEVVDSIRVFDHAGNYLRTLYPFPADKLERVRGLHLGTFPQDGARLPLKEGFHQATLLSSGANAGFDGVGVDRHNNWDGAPSGNAATAMAVRAGRLALAQLAVNRMATDGSTGGMSLHGPAVTFPMTLSGNYRYSARTVRQARPTSAALSPDGKTLYLAGYLVHDVFFRDGLHGVVRVAMDGDAPPETFVGSMQQQESGTDNAHFRVALTVACDEAGRVYVGDYMNDRIQVYSPEGKFLKTIPATKPAAISIQRRTGEIYVFSWMVQCRMWQEELAAAEKARRPRPEVKPTVTRLGPFEDPRPRASYPLPIWIASGAFDYRKFPPPGLVYVWAEVDSWADPPTIWLGMHRGRTGEFGVEGGLADDPWEKAGIRMLVEQDGKLVVKRDFGAEVGQSIVRAAPPVFQRQRLAFNPGDGKLYLLEIDGGFGKSVLGILQLDPETGKARAFDLPYDTEDLAFDMNGHAYLRAWTAVGRFDPTGWREVPWDYGEERTAVNQNNGSGRKRRAPLISGLIVPVERYNHQGGLYVAPNGHTVVCSYFGKQEPKTRYEVPVAHAAGKPFAFQLYPGRQSFGLVSIWDRHGRILHRDALQGLAFTNGIAIDRDDNIYVMSSANRVLDGKPYLNAQAGTLMKFRPGAGKIVATHRAVPVQLAAADRPGRPPDLAAGGGGRLGDAWVEGAQWFYGGVGFGGRSRISPAYGCDCWNSRFALDYFARSFAPEVDHYSVAVLDTSGNLILRVGRYGNVDDGKPLVAEGGPANPRSIGGDEVGLFHAAYVGTDTDRRLFIADAGNSRILSVRLDYHATERVPLKGVPDRGAKQ